MKKGNNKEIISLIESRLEKGKREYNQEVDVHDGREWINEALEELLDACVYLSAQILLLKKREVLMSDKVLKVEDSIVESSGFDVIRDLHITVSNEDTPKSFVKNKMGTDYVEYSYMRKIADKHFPGWSWTIVKTEMLGSEAFMVHGRLRWFDGGLWREGDSTAAHRIMQKRDGSGFVDVGNDIKSANTDCIKKAFNMYLNIADDVYRNRVPDTELTQEDIDYLYKEMEGLNDEWKEKISLSIEGGSVEKSDMSKVVTRINQIKEEMNE